MTYPRLLFQFIFQPSRWRRELARIAPDLPADFCLADLRARHWRQRDLAGLLLTAYALGPLYGVAVSGAGLWLSGQSWDIGLRALLYGFALSLIGGPLCGLVVSFAFSVVAALLGAVLIAWLYALDPVWSLLAGLCALGAASHVVLSVSEESATIGLLRRSGAVLLSLFATALFLGGGAFIGHGVLAWLFEDSLYLWAFGAALGIGLAFGFYTRHGYWAAILACGFGLGLSGLFFHHAMRTAPDWLNPLAGGAMNALLFPLLFGLPYALAKDMADRLSGIIAGLLGSAGVYIAVMLLYGQPVMAISLGGVTGFVLGLSYHWWRSPFFYPFEMLYNGFLFRAAQHRNAPRLLQRHSAYWDERQRLPLYGLDKQLVWLAEQDQTLADQAFNFLLPTPQRWAVAAAQLELSIRALENARSLERIENVHRALPKTTLSGELQSYLAGFCALSADIADFSARRETRKAMDDVLDKASLLLRELTHSQHPQALRLCRILENWRGQLILAQRALEQSARQDTPLKNPYITGVPLNTLVSEVFVGRRDIAARIGALAQAPYAPPILLLGQRRMGKTSLLNHLERLLDADCLPIVLDLQGISTVHSGAFFYNIARIVTRNARRSGHPLPEINRERFQREPLTDFNEWLDDVEDALNGQRLLLAFDELETLENAFKDGSLERGQILGGLRHLIQHRPAFKLLLAGAYIDASWAGYLINAESLRLDYLQPEEARELIQNPLKGMLNYEPGAMTRIQSLTGGHPALLQYLCKAIVNLKNRQSGKARERVTDTDVEEAVPDALQSASQFFIYLQQALPGETLELLINFAHRGENISFELKPFDKAFKLEESGVLRRSSNNQHYFHIDMIRRWFLSEKASNSR